MMARQATELSGADVRGGSGAMFDRVAPRYDLLNRLLSLGLDRRWRRAAVRALELAPGDAALDLATGTGDVALEMLRQQPACRVVGVDPSAGMLEVGRAKVAAAGLADRVELEVGQAEELGFADGSFDAAAIAFGIRNVADRERGLRELSRVVRPGGRIAILELGEPRGLLALGARIHMRVVGPALGALLSNRSAYRYLPRSIAAFPSPAEFVCAMEASGHDAVRVTAFASGVCNLFVSRSAGRPL